MTFDLSGYLGPHGTTAYRRGCRCDACCEAHRVDHRERRWRQHGRPVRRSTEERFWSKVCRTEDCWLWTGSLDSNGYGMFKVGQRTERAHRVSYVFANGPVADGLVLDHLCRVRNCVRPDHLEPVTNAENMRRSRLSHCKRGHPFNEENTVWQRVCRACWKSRREERRVAS